METWADWTEHVMHCPQCARATLVTGNLDKAFLAKLCSTGQSLYETYRYRGAQLPI